MDFFKSVFSDPVDPPSDDDHDPHPSEDAASDPPDSAAAAGIWGFGGIIKTIASKSESVIQNYRRDLEEFGSGLRKETAALGEAAARAVRDLPGSLEAGASVAQESIESVGRAVDDIGGTVWRGTAEIISHGKEAMLALDAEGAASDSEASGPTSSVPSKRYSRFDMQVLALQNDQNTFLEDPEDVEEFDAWRKEFELDEKEEEIDELCAEYASLEGMFDKLVPKVVQYENFWTRYFYKVHKLKQAEDARAEIVKRVISAEEEEELSWEVDDDEEDTAKPAIKEDGNPDGEGEAALSEDGVGRSSNVEIAEKTIAEKPQVGILADVEENMPIEKSESEGKAEPEEVKMENVESHREDVVEKSIHPTMPEEKAKSFEPVESLKDSEPVESCKDSDFSVVSSQLSVAEVEDLGWDEIEDLGEHEEKRTSTSGGSPTKIDVRKRPSVAVDDEDLSWDIEDE